MPDARLYLLTPALTAADLTTFAPRLAAALAAGDVASVLVRLAAGAEQKRVVPPLFEIAAAHETALLLEGDARLAARLGADGVHVDGADVADAVASFKSRTHRRGGAAEAARRRDVGRRGGRRLRDVRRAGARRRTPLATTLERVSWWAEIFETPCVAYAARLEDVAPLAEAGADFIALDDAVWDGR